MRQKAAAGAWRAEMSGSTAAHVRFWQRQKATALLPQLLVCQGQQPSALCDCRAATCWRGGRRRRRCGARSGMPSLYASQAPSTCSHEVRWRYLRVWVVQIGCGYRPLRNFPALSFCLCLLGACSQSLHVRASATNGGVATHPAARVARCGKGCNKEHAHWLPCPRVALQKQHLPCCQYLPGRQPVFCFVLRALRLVATAFAQQGTRYEAFEQTLTPCGAAATA